MIINLIDTNADIVEAWKIQFDECPHVNVIHGSIFDTKADALVSPANSYGFMDGGLDYAISQHFGWDLQKRLQIKIQEECYGELLVGQTLTLHTNDSSIPYLISAPTMRVPLVLKDSVNVYLAAKAIFIELKTNTLGIESVSILGLGTGVGEITPETCASQMKQAYDDIIADKFQSPKSWLDAQNKHRILANKRDDVKANITPVGTVLSEDQMGIGYDRRMGDKVWFRKAPPGYLYAERDLNL